MTTPSLLSTQSTGGYYAGDDIAIQRDIENVTVTDPIVQAWLTIKKNPTDADPGQLQKVITSTLSAAGQITADGSVSDGNGTASVVFFLTAADTLGLGVQLWYYDVQVKTTAGKIYTATPSEPDKGRIRLLRGVTDATS